MSRKYVIGIDGSGVDEAIDGIERFRQSLDKKCDELCNRLAEFGVKIASAHFSTARYDGTNDVNVTVEQRGERAYAVIATGEATLFLEFGSGVTLGYGHPEAGKYGMGPGTYPIPPGKGHWNDPGGWYLPKEKGGRHTYGNPPSGAMYTARKEIEMEIARIAQEVFGSD